MALAGTAAACSDPQVSAQQKRAVAGILQSPKASTRPSSGHNAAATTTTVTSKPGTTPTTSAAGPGAASTTPTTTTSGAGSSPSSGSNGSTQSTSGSGSPPNVVGLSLSSAENQLGAAGFSASAQPWGGSCSTPGQVMQQVPPQSGTVQLFYCTKVT